jgi:hypothetical protein
VRKALSLALLAESFVIAVLLAVVADQVAHTRVERLGGVNIWGYRGPVLHQKQTNEIRIAVVGGDLAFGWGVAASETLAPSLRDSVSPAVAASRRRQSNVTAVTLGAFGLAPSEYAAWIAHHAALRPDVICIVTDPSRHRLADSPFLPARRSAVFQAFGYSPILPLVLKEKGTMRHSAPARLAGEALAFADEAFRAHGAPTVASTDAASYLSALEVAIRAAVHTATAGVVVVAAPDAAIDSVDRRGVRELVASTFSAAPVRFVDLGDDAAMRGDALRLDGFNFSTAGHAVAARDVAPAVIDLLGLAGGGPR